MSDVLVVCYHGVSPSWSSPYSVTPARLRTQVSTLLRRGYRPATLSEAIAAPSAQRTLAVTFDDALHSVREHAFPALRALGVPATVFACTAWIGGPHEGERMSLGWDDLAALRDAGWEIGSHTHTHPRLTRVSDAELRSELTQSKRELEERLGRECAALAYPCGDVDDRVVAATRAAGYAIACTATAGVAAADPLLYPRTVVLHRDGLARFLVKTSRIGRRMRGSRRAWRLVAPAYRALGGERKPA